MFKGNENISMNLFCLAVVFSNYPMEKVFVSSWSYVLNSFSLSTSPLCDRDISSKCSKFDLLQFSFPACLLILCDFLSRVFFWPYQTWGHNFLYQSHPITLACCGSFVTESDQKKRSKIHPRESASKRQV